MFVDVEDKLVREEKAEDRVLGLRLPVTDELEANEGFRLIYDGMSYARGKLSCSLPCDFSSNSHSRTEPSGSTGIVPISRVLRDID